MCMYYGTVLYKVQNFLRRQESMEKATTSEEVEGGHEKRKIQHEMNWLTQRSHSPLFVRDEQDY